MWRYVQIALFALGLALALNAGVDRDGPGRDEVNYYMVR